MHNFIIRSISGVVFATIILASLLWKPILFVLVFTFIILVMMREYFNITIGRKHPIGQSLAKLAGVSLFIITYFIYYQGISPIYLILTIIPCILIMISLLYDKDKEAYKVYPYLLSSIIYIAVPFAMCNIIAFNNMIFDGKIILSMLLILWSSDVGAYIFGITLGQKFGHKLFPSISPKKSWIGYIGSVITSILAGIILSKVELLPISILLGAILGLIINVFGTLGDLAESQLKRNFGVKDSGTIMPGHGGLLDRFDGALLAFPIAVIYLIFILSL